MEFLAAITIFALCVCTGFTTPVTKTKCHKPYGLVDIDWTKMGGVWYDIIDIPTTPSRVTCWDWTEIKAKNNGTEFESLIVKRLPGKMKRTTFLRNMLADGEQTFVVEGKSKKDFVSSSVEILEEEKNSEITKIAQRADYVYSWQWFFITDYDNYFIPVNCLETGWQAFVKSRRHWVDENDIVNISNLLQKHGICAHMQLKRPCIEDPSVSAENIQ